MHKVTRGRPSGINLAPIKTSELGVLIRNYRTLNRVGLDFVAKKLGIKAQFISNIEHGRASLPVKHVVKLAKLLNISPAKLANVAMMSRPSVAKFVEPSYFSVAQG